MKAYQDDLIVFGRNEEIHRENLAAVLKRLMHGVLYIYMEWPQEFKAASSRAIKNLLDLDGIWLNI